MKLTRQFGCALAANVVLAVGCGEAASGDTVVAGSDGGARSDASLGGACTGSAVQACTCPATSSSPLMSGSQHCYNGAWLLCNCSAPTTTPVPVNTAGECKPGLYEGTFSGLYTSPYTFVGVPIPVVALNAFGPGLAFTLNAQFTAAGEFSELTISDGYVKGTADGIFPFEGVLTGTLDCPTKTFTGKLTGHYCVGPCLGPGVNQGDFDGPVTGNYDGQTYKFTNGTWDLLELEGKMGILGNFGGNGDWSADWVGEGSVDLDSGVTVHADGGTGAPTPGFDAGVGP